tara:strand:- start:109 stop:561 length:453 start_codon:yes stop_codon:yes gene_type:complete
MTIFQTKSFNLREITKNDSSVLLEWRNEMRWNFFNSDVISKITHNKYIKDTLKNSKRLQLILEYNNMPIGTIREDSLSDDEFELSYTVSPKYRGNEIGKIMMELYLIGRKGSFLCVVKENNIPSIKMIEKLKFKLYKSENKVNFYKLIIK